MQRIKELIVVEGKHDIRKLKKLFDCDVICTNGLSMSPEVLDTITAIGKKKGVIVLTDPDHPGEVIRNKIAEIVPDCQHVFINKKDAIGKRNVGVEYADDDVLVKALENRITFDREKETLSWSEYCSLGLIGSRSARIALCEKLHITYSNNKTLFRRLNMMGLTLKDIQELL
ncbi:MAG: ribonuclease M5 [Erysipelotrichaceae bacterium]|nr:ribonuclease M5 [Erysipelotrichaceae bacterium]